MKDLSTSEMAKMLRDRMKAEHKTLAAVVKDLGLDYNAVYWKLTNDGWRIRTTLVKVRRPSKAQEVAR